MRPSWLLLARMASKRDRAGHGQKSLAADRAAGAPFDCFQSPSFGAALKKPRVMRRDGTPVESRGPGRRSCRTILTGLADIYRPALDLAPDRLPIIRLKSS